MSVSLILSGEIETVDCRLHEQLNISKKFHPDNTVVKAWGAGAKRGQWEGKGDMESFQHKDLKKKKEILVSRHFFFWWLCVYMLFL